jgi:hypothetical protein
VENAWFFEEFVIVLGLFYFSEKNEMFWFTNEVDLAIDSLLDSNNRVGGVFFNKFDYFKLGN